jgi:hypothetical protein
MFLLTSILVAVAFIAGVAAGIIALHALVHAYIVSRY